MGLLVIVCLHVLELTTSVFGCPHVFRCGTRPLPVRLVRTVPGLGLGGLGRVAYGQRSQGSLCGSRSSSSFTQGQLVLSTCAAFHFLAT